jgi:5-methylcytosine-specific restriction endonuclease McrA
MPDYKKPYKKPENLIRVGVFSIEEVFTHLNKVWTTKNKTNFNGFKVSTSSVRMRTFLLKGTNCVSCGIQGKFFALERYAKDEVYHFNLYGEDNVERNNGSEMLMTKDHIIPKSISKDNRLSNMQTMCARCNGRKGDTYEESVNKETVKV